MQDGQTEKEEVRQQQRMKVMEDMTKKIRAKERMEANHSWWVSCWPLTARKRGSIQDGKTLCRDGVIDCTK